MDDLITLIFCLIMSKYLSKVNFPYLAAKKHPASLPQPNGGIIWFIIKDKDVHRGWAPDRAQGSLKVYRALCVAVLTAGIKS